MTPADEIRQACALILAAEDKLRLVRLVAKARRPELDAEMAVLARSRERLTVVRSRILGMGWRRFIDLTQGQEPGPPREGP